MLIKNIMNQILLNIQDLNLGPKGFEVLKLTN